MPAAAEPIAQNTMLTDRFGRVANDLRISLTDLCSLRCTYCMPAEGLDWLSKAQRLTDDEIVRLAGVFVDHGVRSIRLTGGEPLVHPTVHGVVRSLAALRPAPEISLTTNGVTLARHARELAEAGLHRINVSLDTLRTDRFAALTRRDRLAQVLAGIEAAAQAGLAPVKINAVLLRGQNFDEASALLHWALRHGYQLRFIEHMPLDADRSWSAEQMVCAEEILAELGRDYRLAPTAGRGSAPAELFDVLDGPDRDTWPDPQPQVGVIAAVTRPFCRDCDRLRLTADGQLRTCLFSQGETDLRGPLRAGATDAELSALIVRAVAGKQAGHGIGLAGFAQPSRTMSAIGG